MDYPHLADALFACKEDASGSEIACRRPNYGVAIFQEFSLHCFLPFRVLTIFYVSRFSHP